MKLQKRYNNLLIKSKLIFSLSNIVTVMVILGIIGIVSVTKIENESRQMYERYNQGISYLSTIGVDFNQTHANAVVLVAGEGTKEDIIVRVSDFKENITSNFEKYKGLITNEADLNNIAGLEEDLNSYLVDQAEVVRLYEAGQENEAYDLLYGQAYDTHLRINNSIIETTNKDVSGSEEKLEYITTIKNIFLIVISAAVILGFILSLTTIKSLSTSIASRLKKLMDITKKIAVGDINVNIDDELLNRDEIGSLAKEMDNMIETIKNQAYVADRIAEGDFLTRCELRSDKDVLSKSINTIADQFEKLVSELGMLGQASEEGRLDVRGDTSEFKGAYKELVEGLHGSLDAFREPIIFVSEVLEKMAAGEQAPSLDRGYKGDYSVLLSSLEHVYNSTSELYEEINKLLDASERGDLRVKADASRVKGSYRYMINGLNGIFDKVSEPLIEASTVLAKMSKGDLTVKVEGNYKGDYANVKNSLNYVIDTFNEILKHIVSASDQVAVGAKQISDSSILLSEGTTEQASSIQQLTASTEEISSQTRLNADNAEEVATLTQSSKDNAGQGNKNMKELLIAMHEINESSNNISRVIKVIEDIAFQTNILALNAAVEAARAGQYGKGFAVVAEEVKNLAQRSANAAKETTEMIENSISKSENGKKVANETAKDLIKIVRDAEEVANLVDDITKASREQAIGIDQINQGIMQVSEVVQTNSATSEEAAAASEELASQADILREEVNKFKISSSLEASYTSERLNPEVDKMLDNMSSEKKSDFSKEAATSKEKPTINLDDSDFGKYQ